MRSALRIVFIAELVLLALPLSLLFLVFGVGIFLSSAIAQPGGPSIALAVLAILASLSLVAGWVLSFRYLRGGASALALHATSWWFLSALGALLLLAALASRLAPQTEPYSHWGQFRQDIAYFSFGVPLLIPFTHLVFERLGVMGANYSLKRTAANRLDVD